MAEPNYYLETLARMEQDIASVDPGAFYASAAISLKRIADALHGKAIVSSYRQTHFLLADPTPELGTGSTLTMGLFPSQRHAEAAYAGYMSAGLWPNFYKMQIEPIGGA